MWNCYGIFRDKRKSSEHAYFFLLLHKAFNIFMASYLEIQAVKRVYYSANKKKRHNLKTRSTNNIHM